MILKIGGREGDQGPQGSQGDQGPRSSPNYPKPSKSIQNHSKAFFVVQNNSGWTQKCNRLPDKRINKVLSLKCCTCRIMNQTTSLSFAQGDWKNTHDVGT